MVGDDESGRDLAQETFLKGWQALPRLEGEVRFQPWLYKIATNSARDHLRRKRLIAWLPWKEHVIFARGEDISVPGPEESTEEQEFLTFALMQVPLKYRQCVILQIVEACSQREIAQLLGISETSVSTYVRRGLEKLRQIYFQPEHERWKSTFGWQYQRHIYDFR
jgi:RNA polymerase sigma-70 factor, ECF subfamily